jgi:hypothetical protein
MMESIPNILSVIALENHKIRVQFEDGVSKEINIRPFIKQGVSSLLNDETYFKQVKAENGYITWPNGFDFCPEFLRNHV